MAGHVAIIGAGIAGLTAARMLSDSGVRVSVFDKGRGPGGRTSRRRTREGVSFDHGAQYFVVQHARFREQVEQWQSAGHVAVWRPRLCVFKANHLVAHPSPEAPMRYVGVPGMNAMARALADGIELHLKTRIVQLHDAEAPDRRASGASENTPARWSLVCETGDHFGAFTHVLLTPPAPQTGALLDGHGRLADAVGRVVMVPTWSILLAYEEPLAVGFDAAFVDQGPLSWIARNSSKPGRAESPDTWVLHATHEWTQENLRTAPEEILAFLLKEFVVCSGTSRAGKPDFHDMHRWAYASPPEPLTERCLVDPDRKLVVAGDWCGDNRVEGAYLSGRAAAEWLTRISTRST